MKLFSTMLVVALLAVATVARADDYEDEIATPSLPSSAQEEVVVGEDTDPAPALDYGYMPSWAHGCCERVPSHADRLWDGYCHERHHSCGWGHCRMFDGHLFGDLWPTSHCCGKTFCGNGPFQKGCCKQKCCRQKCCKQKCKPRCKPTCRKQKCKPKCCKQKCCHKLHLPKIRLPKLRCAKAKCCLSKMKCCNAKARLTKVRKRCCHKLRLPKLRLFHRCCKPKCCGKGKGAAGTVIEDTVIEGTEPNAIPAPDMDGVDAPLPPPADPSA